MINGLLTMFQFLYTFAWNIDFLITQKYYFNRGAITNVFYK
ncbi:hypothetical protein ABID96_002124 [Bacillus sp. OAE603]